ncbi:MAG: TetR/AcrR family transcriptional regulator [Corynebacteriales bacterium]|nr:TetR/AcrR family transcriptional regulator [Mycobacteriales bacterium]
MSEIRSRKIRSDAKQSMSSILEAAIAVLNERPEASMEEVAKSAGVTRQTVYAHFPNRTALVNAALTHVTNAATKAMDEAELEKGSARAALNRFLEASWHTAQLYPFALLINAPQTNDNSSHQPISERLGQLIDRGQQNGEFDKALPRTWLIRATIALGHAIGKEVSAGQTTTKEAASLLQTSVLRLYGTTDTR